MTQITFNCGHTAQVVTSEELIDLLASHPDLFAEDLCPTCSMEMETAMQAEAEELSMQHDPFCACDECYDLPITRQVAWEDLLEIELTQEPCPECQGVSLYTPASDLVYDGCVCGKVLTEGHSPVCTCVRCMSVAGMSNVYE